MNKRRRRKKRICYSCNFEIRTEFCKVSSRNVRSSSESRSIRSVDKFYHSCTETVSKKGKRNYYLHHHTLHTKKIEKYIHYIHYSLFIDYFQFKFFAVDEKEIHSSTILVR